MAMYPQGGRTVAAAVVIASVAACAAPPAQPRSPFEFPMTAQLQSVFDRPPEPPAMQPLAAPVLLRFKPTGHFVYSWAGFGNMTKGNAFLLEGFQMEGSVSADPDGLLWRYTLANLGHDQVLRLWGEMEAVTDDLGRVKRARVIRSELPPYPRGLEPGSFAYFNAEKLDFPLCCLPEQPVSQGARHSLEGPGQGEEEVLGIAAQGGRRQIVTRSIRQVEVSEGGLTMQGHGVAIRSEDIDDPVRSTQVRRLEMPIPADVLARASPTMLPAFVTVWVYGDGDAPFLRWR